MIAFPIQFYHLPVSFSNSTINSYAAAAATFCQAKIAERPQRWMQNLVEPQLLGTFGGEDSGLGGPGFYYREPRVFTIAHICLSNGI